MWGIKNFCREVERGINFQYHTCMMDLLPDLLKDTPVALDGVRCVRRIRKTLPLPSDAYPVVLPLFKHYMDSWNALVHKDRSGQRIQRRSPVERDYVNRRKLSLNPLRLRNWNRTVSLPVTSELKRALKPWVKIDWRRVSKARMIRSGNEVTLSYVKTTEVVLPRPTSVMYDMGVCLTNEGMFLRLQTPTDQPLSHFIRKSSLTKQFINELAQRMHGRVRLVALDPLVPNGMLSIKNHFVRKIRNTQAECATVFRTPRRIPLGEKYLNHSKGSTHRLKGRLRGAMKGWSDYSLILGLTGEPLLVREREGELVTGPMDKSVHPIARANDALQTALAKLDLWHSATFLRSRDSQRVRNAFRRILKRMRTTICLTS